MTQRNPTTDTIHIEQLEVFARVGVPDAERSEAQRLTFNLTLSPRGTDSALNDDIARTVDYALVCAEVRALVERRADRLIETLADAVARHLLERFAIETIVVELRKYILPEVDFVSVTLTRSRSG